MAELVALPQFRLLLLCSAIMALNLMALAIGTVVTRSGAKRYVNPEDSKVSSKEAKVLEGAEPELAGRFVRAHRNALENIPTFFSIGLLYVLSGGSLLGAKAYFWTFVAARWLHSIAYVKALQPWRTIFFVVGLASLLGMTVHVLRAGL